MISGSYQDRRDTVEIPRELFAELIEIVAYPPLRRGKYSQNAGVYWPRILRARTALESLGVDWVGLHGKIHGK